MRLARTAAMAASVFGVTACGSSNPASPSVFSVVITAPKQTIAVGEAVQLTTTARDANGVTIGGAKITYTTSPLGIVTVNATGRVIGVAPGNATVTALSGGQSSPPFAMTVTAATVAGVVTRQVDSFR